MDAHPVRQRERCDLALRSLIERLQRRRRASENQPRPLELRAHGRRVARVISRGGALFVAGFVLFVHHDRAQALHGREHSRSGADSDETFAAAQRAPCVGALAVG